MPTTGFEPAIPASERQQIYAFDSATVGIGRNIFDCSQYFVIYAPVAGRNSNTSLCKVCSEKPSSSLILNRDRADKGELTSEAVQVYCAKANRNSAAYFEYGLGFHMKILKGLSACVSKSNEIKKRVKRAGLEGKCPN